MTFKRYRYGISKHVVVMASAAMLLSACQTLDKLRVYTAADYEALPASQIQQKISASDDGEHRIFTGPRIVLGNMQYAFFRKLVDHKTDTASYQVKLDLTYVEPKRNYNRVRDTMGMAFTVENTVMNGGCYSESVCTAIEQLTIEIPQDYLQEHKLDGLFLSAISNDRASTMEATIPSTYLQAVMSFNPASGGVS